MESLQNRKWVILLIMLFTCLIFVFRLLYIQVIDDKWHDRAYDISHSEKTLHPSRGLIYDRNGKLLVSANEVYDIKVIPDEIGVIDTLKVCRILSITKEQFDKKIKAACEHPNVSYKASVFINGLSEPSFSQLSPKIKPLKGFEFETRTVRGYPKHVAAHVLGYIRNISEKQYNADQEGDKYYLINDYIGITGIEKEYEKELRGERGKKYYLADKAGNAETSLGQDYAIAGHDLYTTLDVDLQAYGEKLMQNKLGCIVAIEPKSGEILSMVSAPSYDPNLMVGRAFSSNWSEMSQNDSLTPLINRSIYTDTYRPGSIFKLVQSLIALQEGVIQPNTGFACNKGLIGCHNHPHPANVQTAIQHSCNPYFYQVYKRLIQRGEDKSVFKDSRIGLEKWNKSVKSFGLGTKFNTDIPGVKSGLIPDANFYDNEIDRGGGLHGYGAYSWAFSTIYSNSIGEGEIGVSPLQMANLAAILANRGFYYTPHLVKSIGKDGDKRPDFMVKHYTAVDSVHFTPVVDAMEQVVISGTGRRAQIDSVAVCGKTGSVQNRPHNAHSVFIAFAPKENPQIAIAVYVEHGVAGGYWAARIASLMMENYLYPDRELSTKAKEKEKKVLDAIILHKDAEAKY